ncbi:MAG: hypothetical protein M3O50_20405, partial [Myxococcota bacterium]|nr:hypothetical protein [Myxococcota bacterium]
MSDSFLRDLRAAGAAGTPIVCVVTHEEARLRALVGEAFPGTRIVDWTVTRGWSDGEATCEPLAGVAAAMRGGEVGITRIMLDLHPWLDDARVVRALRDLTAVARKTPLVLAMPAAKLPPELDRDARFLTLPLPGVTEVGAAFDALLAGSAVRWPRDQFVRAALGLTLNEASRAFRLARAIPDRHEALQRLIAEKAG